MFGLKEAEALVALERRAKRLRETIAELDRELRDESGPPRLFLLETEYIRTVTAAELDWVDRVVDDINAGRLTWSQIDFAAIAANFTPPDSV